MQIYGKRKAIAAVEHGVHHLPPSWYPEGNNGVTIDSVGNSSSGELSSISSLNFQKVAPLSACSRVPLTSWTFPTCSLFLFLEQGLLWDYVQASSTQSNQRESFPQ